MALIVRSFPFLEVTPFTASGTSLSGRVGDVRAGRESFLGVVLCHQTRFLTGLVGRVGGSVMRFLNKLNGVVRERSDQSVCTNTGA